MGVRRIGADFRERNVGFVGTLAFFGAASLPRTIPESVPNVPRTILLVTPNAPIRRGVRQLVDGAPPVARRMRHHVLGIHQAAKMVPELRASHPQALSRLAPSEADLTASDAVLPSRLADEGIELPEKPLRDGR